MAQTKAIIAIAAGYHHSLALGYDGVIWTWGMDVLKTIHSYTPKRILELDNVVAISAGIVHDVALKSDGTVWTWGKNIFRGQSKNHSKRHPPKQVDGLKGMIAISAGDEHNLALRDDGTVWAWGSNDCGQLGSEQVEPTEKGVLVNGLEEIVDISAGPYHNLALRNDGTVWGWGFNHDHLLGFETGETPYPIPTLISKLSHIRLISTGRYHNVAIGDDIVWTWGSYDYGENEKPIIENGITQIYLSDLSNHLLKVSSGHGYSIVLAQNGTVWLWGKSDNKQLEQDSITKHLVPRQVSCLPEINEISAGETHCLALEGNGSIWSWGSNRYGESGNDVDHSMLPVQVTWPD